MRVVRILVAEDEARLAGAVRRVLREEGHVADVSGDGEEALALALTGDYDLLLLDVMLPERDGYSVARELRARGKRLPILMLTARDAVADRVAGLDAGADDYLVKPFALSELLARIRALARRAQVTAPETTLRVGDLELDLTRREARRGSRTIELTTREFTLLELFMRHPGQVFTRAQILNRVWGLDGLTESNVVDTYVHYLRTKIDRDFEAKLIRTVRGAGYTLRAG
jgi:two-component system OmpR family response regulator